jgi:hypothetical protein
MVENVSDEELDSAKQDVYARYRQIVEMIPSSKALHESKPRDINKDNLFQT